MIEIIPCKAFEFDCQYDEMRDIKQVNQLGDFDLAKAYVTGSVPADVSLSDSHFNGVTDPRSLVGRPSDVFDVMQAGKAISDYAKQSKQSKEKSGDQ